MKTSWPWWRKAIFALTLEFIYFYYAAVVAVVVTITLGMSFLIWLFEPPAARRAPFNGRELTLAGLLTLAHLVRMTPVFVRYLRHPIASLEA